eukprot:UN25544
MRAFCVSDSLLYVRIYSGAPSTNCLMGTALSADPKEPDTVTSSLLYEAFLPKDVCSPMFTGTGGPTPLSGVASNPHVTHII